MNTIKKEKKEKIKLHKFFFPKENLTIEAINIEEAIKLLTK